LAREGEAQQDMVCLCIQACRCGGMAFGWSL